MIPEKNFNGPSPDDLRMENELTKIRLMFEHGADFHSSDNIDLPPELEYQFLKNIEAFENAHAGAGEITIYDFIGCPPFTSEDELGDSELAQALVMIQKILASHQIDLDSICEVDSRTMYHFITREFFHHKIENFHIEGLIRGFIYEEFHPNHEYDIRDHSTCFISSFLKKDPMTYARYCTSDPDVIKGFENFSNSYESFSLSDFNIEQIIFNKEKAMVNFNINFFGILEGTREKLIFDGIGRMELIYHNDYWCVNQILFPPYA